MGAPVPKQFLEIGGRPILMHTLQLFAESDLQIGLVLVLPAAHMDFWQALCRQHDFTIPHKVVEGGGTRFQSVKNGLEVLSGEGLVAVHDGVRPFVSKEVIAAGFAEALVHGNAVASRPSKESIREVVDETTGRSVSRERTRYRLIQTPQTFNIRLLKRAYQQEESDAFTDDASVVEKLGETIHLIEGNPENIKITDAADLLFAHALWQNKKSPA